MTKEELEKIKSVGVSAAIGERSPDEFYELLAINAGDLIAAAEAYEESMHQLKYLDDLRKMLYEKENKTEELKTLLKQSVPNWADPIEDGLCPTFYLTLTAEGDRKIQERIKKALE